VALSVLLVFCIRRSAAQELCRDPVDCPAAQTDLCGAASGPLQRTDQIMLCLGFQQPGGPSANGSKALFRVKVDSFSTLKVDTLRTLMGMDWDHRKEAHSQMWVGVHGRRTVGQQRGLWSAEAGGCNATSGPVPADAVVCYGWTEHNKPVVTPDFWLSTGLTVIVHLDQGVVNRIVWDSSCNLCGSTSDADVTCRWDQSNITCSGGEANSCSDCYVQLTPGTCHASSDVCSPHIYVAWVGTDKHGQPLLSAGSVLSRFADFAVAGVTNAIIEEVTKLADDF